MSTLTYPEGIRAITLEDELPHNVMADAEFWAPVILLRDPQSGKVWKWGGNVENRRIETVAQISADTVRLYGDGVEFIANLTTGYRKVTIDKNFEGKFTGYPGWELVQVGDIVEFQQFKPKSVFWSNLAQPLTIYPYIIEEMHYQPLGVAVLHRGSQTLEGIGSFQHIWMKSNSYEAQKHVSRQDAFHIFADKLVVFIQSFVIEGEEWRDGMVYFLDDYTYDVVGESAGGFPYDIVDGLNRLSYIMTTNSHRGKIQAYLFDSLYQAPITYGFQQEYWSKVTATLNSQVLSGGVATSETIRLPLGCFIATAAYGSPLAKELNVLRHFRDNYLPPKLASTYYYLSPSIAKAVAKHNTLRCLTRTGLKPAVEILK